MELDFRDDPGTGLGWIAPEPRYMVRASHALVDEGRLWLVDPVAGPELLERLGPLGEPAGVVQLLDRHPRDCAALADRLGVPLHLTPFARIAGAPFVTIPLARSRWWTEIALWWPERRALLVADALGTAPYFRAPGAVVGVHPLLRLRPPRALAEPAPEHLLPGHGESLHGPETAAAVRAAIANARREIPRWLWGLARPGRA